MTTPTTIVFRVTLRPFASDAVIVSERASDSRESVRAWYEAVGTVIDVVEVPQYVTTRPEEQAS